MMRQTADDERGVPPDAVHLKLDRLVFQVAQTSSMISNMVDALHEGRFPSGAPHLFAGVVKRVAEAVRDEIVKRYRQRDDPEDFTVIVQFAVKQLQELAAHLRFVQRATTRETPWSLVRPLELIGEGLYPHTSFVIRPQWEHNYSLFEPLTGYRQALGPLLPPDALDRALEIAYPVDEAADRAHYTAARGQSRVCILGFPYSARLSVLLHASLGHELGHPLVAGYFDEEKPEEFQPAILERASEETKGHRRSDEHTVGSVSKLVSFVKEVTQLRRRVIEEVICDLVSVQLFGLAAAFAMEEYALCRHVYRLGLGQKHYPPWSYRLRVIMEDLTDDWIDDFIEAGRIGEPVRTAVRDRIASIRSMAVDRDVDAEIQANSHARVAYESVKDALPRVRAYVRRCMGTAGDGGYRLDDLKGLVCQELISRLAAGIPPDACVRDDGTEVFVDIRSILNVGWLRWVTQDAEWATADVDADINERLNQSHVLNRLVLKAIEYAYLRGVWKQRDPTVPPVADVGTTEPSNMRQGCLASTSLKRRLRRPHNCTEEPGIVVTPMLDPQHQIGEASLDVRLGTEFVLMRQPNMLCIDPKESAAIEKRILEYQERVRVDFAEPFILHPGHFVLGSTLEYVSLPHDLTAQVIGRSSWGRLGLVIATATAVAPGFKGTITLELANFGLVPLVLYPGVVIAQLVLFTTTDDAVYSGRYDYPTGPQFSRVHRDRDIAWWADRRTFGRPDD